MTHTQFSARESDDLVQTHKRMKLKRAMATDADISALRAVACQARDWAQVGLCDLALGQYDLLDLERADCVSAAEAQGYDGDPDDYKLTELDVDSICQTLGRRLSAEEVEHLGVLNDPDDDVTPATARAECVRVIVEARRQGVDG